MANNIFGRPMDFNSELNELKLKLSFLSPDDQKMLEKWIESGKTIKINFSVLKTESKTYEQQKLFFVDITKILIAKGIAVTGENKNSYYEHLRRTVFPVKFREVVDEEGDRVSEPYPPSIHELSIEEMTHVIDENRNRHTPIIREDKTKVYIDWSKDLHEQFFSKREIIND